MNTIQTICRFDFVIKDGKEYQIVDSNPWAHMHNVKCNVAQDIHWPFVWLDLTDAHPLRKEVSCVIWEIV